MKFFILILFILSVNSPLYANVCEQFFLAKETSASTTYFEEISSSLRTFQDHKILDENQALDMDSFFSIDSALSSIEKNLKEIQNLHPKTYNKEMAFFFENNKSVFTTLEESIGQIKKTTFAPNEYELLNDLNKRLGQFNEHLDEMNIKLIYKLPKTNPRIASLEKSTGEFILKQEELSEKLFPTTGYKNYTNYKKELDSLLENTDAVKMIRAEEVEVVMFRPNSGRWWIEKIGFKNQHVTGSSRGAYTPVGRNAVEASLSGRTYKNFTKLDNDLKPKYAMMTAGFNKPIGFEPPHYGDDVYIFSKNKIKKKTTMTLGDSLNPIPRNKGNRWIEGETFTPDHWNEIFIPWKNRELITPALKDNLKQGRFEISYGGVSDVGLDMKWDRGNEYLETQIWGEIGLESVDKFIFIQKPPSKSYFEILKKHNIKIYDGRNSNLRVDGFSKLKEWKPDFSEGI